MRTTITLDPDTRILVEQLMHERGISFKAAVNEAIRRGLAPRTRASTYTVTAAHGRPGIDLTKSLAIAGELEDDALATRLTEGR